MSQKPVVLQIFVFKNGEFVGTDMFTEREIVVGRDNNVGLALDSPSVARDHAVIEHDGEHVFVRDGGGSTSGIYINGRKVDHSEVGRLDQIVVGEFSLKLKLVSSASPGAPAEAPAKPAAAPKAPVTRARAASRASEDKTRVLNAARAEPRVRAPAPEPAPEPAVSSPRKPMIERQRTELTFKPAAPSPYAVNDDDDEEETYIPTFSMLRQIIDNSAGGRQATHLQIIVSRDDRITEIALLRPGEAFFVPIGGRASRRRRLIVFKGRNEGRLTLSAQAHGKVLQDGHAVDIAEIARTGRGGTLQVSLKRGETASVEDEERSYHISFLRPPELPPDRRPLHARVRPDRIVMRSFGGSLAGHLLLLLLGVLMPSHPSAAPAEVESFAEVKLDKDMSLEEPPPPPPEEKEVEVAPQPAAQPVAKRLEAAPNKRPRAGGTAKAPPGVLGLLSKTGSSAAPGPAAALAAVSNLSAANAPSGSRGFRVSGLASNVATSDILIGGGGGGGLVTKGGAALLRGGGGGAGRLSGKGTRGVGGMVQKMPQAMRSVGQGSLDRDAIQKVINQNVSQIQRCYERELLSKPGLSGKVEVEWTVTTSGSVRAARQKFASLESTTAINCILDRIRTWRFPQPKGGEVVVSYPFVFKSISF